MLFSFQGTIRTFPARHSAFASCGGDEGDRTPYPLLARQVLSQMSYTPTFCEDNDPAPYLPLRYGPQKLNNDITSVLNLGFKAGSLLPSSP